MIIIFCNIYNTAFRIRFSAKIQNSNTFHEYTSNTHIRRIHIIRITLNSPDGQNNSRLLY